MNDILDETIASACKAVAALQARAGGRLDYTAESLGMVDEMLAEVAGYATELPEEAVVGLMQQLGCYVLEVARRRFGGTYYWNEEAEQPILVVGEPDAHVAIMAWSKVLGRLTGDVGDSVEFLFQGFAEKAAAPTAGDNVLFV